VKQFIIGLTCVLGFVAGILAWNAWTDDHAAGSVICADPSAPSAVRAFACD